MKVVNIHTKKEYKPSKDKPIDAIATIGFLTAKLACYEPESSTVQMGLEYLINECKETNEVT